MKPNTPAERLYNGLIKENPTFVMMLGMCPTLAVTTSAMNGLGMGLTTMVVLTMSNMIISLLRKVIPDGVRMPAFIVIVASFVTIVQFASKNKVVPSIFDGIGMGLGFTLGLTSIGIFREILGAGQIFGFQVMPSSYEPITIFILAPGAFFVLAMLVALQNKLKMKKDPEVKTECGSGCASCTNSACGGKLLNSDK